MLIHLKRRPWILTLLLVLLLVLGIEALAVSGWVSPILLAAPSKIARMLIENLFTPSIQTHILITGYRLGLTFLISLGVAVPLSLWFWQSKLMRRMCVPLLGAIFGTPLVLGYLIVVSMFGRGTTAIVVLSFLVGMIPIVLNATEALVSVDETYIQVSRNFNATPLQTFFKVILPAAAPGIFSGIRIGFTYIMISVVAIEFLLVTNHGVGGMISNAYFRFRTVEMYVGISLIVLMVALIITLLGLSERWIRQ